MAVAIVFAIVRILLGGAFIWLGWQKLNDPELLFGGLMRTLEDYGQPFPFYAKLMQQFVEPHQEIFIHAVAIGEILLGASLVLGLLVSAATVGGAFLLLNIAFATTWENWPAFVLHLALAALLIALGRAGSGLVLGLDGWLVGKLPDALVLFPLRRRAPLLQEKRTTPGPRGRGPGSVQPAGGRVPTAKPRR